MFLSWPEVTGAREMWSACPGDDQLTDGRRPMVLSSNIDDAYGQARSYIVYENQEGHK